MRSSRRFLPAALVAFGALLAACSGAVNQAGVPPANPGQSGSVQSTARTRAAVAGDTATSTVLTLSIPLATPKPSASDSARRPHNVAADAEGATIVVTDSVSQATLLSTVLDLATSSKDCSSASGTARMCSFPVDLAPTAANHSDDVAVAIYDKAPSGGTIPNGAKELANGTVSATIVANTANTIPLVVDGTPATLVASVPSIVFTNGGGTEQHALYFSARDADGATIIGTYSQPVTITDEDAAGHTLIGLETASGSSAVLHGSAEAAEVAIAYDGAGGAHYLSSLESSGVPKNLTVPITLFSVSGPSAYSPGRQKVTFSEGGQAVALTLREARFAGTFTESDDCAGIATIAIGPTSAGTAVATVTSGSAGTCVVNFSDGYFGYPAIALDDPSSAASATLETIGDDVAKIADELNAPGVAVDLYDRGKTYTYYYGVQDRATGVKVSADTGFELGSVTKSFTALDLALAVDYPALITSVNPQTSVRHVALTDPASMYVPLYPAAPVESETATGLPCPAAPAATPVPPAMYSATWKAVTLQDLGDHTSTLPDQPPNIFGTGTLPVVDRPCYPAQILQNYAATYDAPSMTTVGTSYLYSDIGFGLLGDALEGIYDAPYYDLTNSLVLEPLGMTHTFDVSGAAAGYGANYATPYLIDGNTPEFHWPYNAWPGGGTLRSTAPDMMNYLLAAMRLSSNPKINTAMKTAQTPVGTVAGPNPQGLAWSNITLKATKTGDAFTVTQKDGATGGMTAWIGLVNPGTKDGTGVLVMVNEVGGGDEPGAASPATGIGSAILRDLGP